MLEFFMMNILLADDVEGWLNFHKSNLQKIFNNKEINIYTFPSAKEAYDFAFAFQGRIDLVITDLQMEYMEKLAGEWLVETLKNTKATELAKFIIVSSDPHISFVAERTGADGFLRKASYHLNPLMLEYLLKEIGILKE